MKPYRVIQWSTMSVIAEPLHSNRDFSIIGTNTDSFQWLTFAKSIYFNKAEKFNSLFLKWLLNIKNRKTNFFFQC